MKKHSILGFLGMLSIFMVTLAGCASTAHIEKDDSVDFSSFKTFAWLDAAVKNGDGKRVGNDLADSKVRDLVSAELQKMGWKETSRNPDIMLTADLLVEKATREHNDPVYTQPFTRVYFNPYLRRYFTVYYPSRFMGYDNYADEIREGTLSLSMIDTRSDRTVWQGWSTEQINSHQFTTRELQSGVKAIFRKFDVAKR